jgi:hypothetical protein
MRLRDWQIRLEALVRERQDQPFAWGLRDCCLWAADVVQAVTGRDPAADLRGLYTTGHEAAMVYARERDLRRACRKRVGPRIRPEQAQPGDIGLVTGMSMPMLVAHVGGGWMGQGHDGLVPIKPEAVRSAWRVG